MRSREITKKLKNADQEVSRYVKELEKENLRLHKKIARLQAKNLSMENEIKALKQARPKLILNINPPENENK